MIPQKFLTPKNTNILGYYRKCAQPICEIYITCPYVMCNKHWGVEQEEPFKEWKE